MESPNAAQLPPLAPGSTGQKAHAVTVHALVQHCVRSVPAAKRFSTLSEPELLITWSTLCRQIHQQIATTRRSVAVPCLGTFSVRRLPLKGSTSHTHTLSTVGMKEGIPAARPDNVAAFADAFATVAPATRPATAAEAAYHDAWEQASARSAATLSSLASSVNSRQERHSRAHAYSIVFQAAPMFDKLPHFSASRPAGPAGDHVMPTVGVNWMNMALTTGLSRAEMEAGVRDVMFAALRMLAAGTPRVRLELAQVAHVVLTPRGAHARFLAPVWSGSTANSSRGSVGSLSGFSTPAFRLEQDETPAVDLAGEPEEEELEKPQPAPEYSLTPRTDAEMLELLRINRRQVTHYHEFTGDRLWKNGRCPICTHEQSPSPDPQARTRAREQQMQEDLAQLAANQQADAAHHAAEAAEERLVATTAVEFAAANRALSDEHRQRALAVEKRPSTPQTVQPSVLASCGIVGSVTTSPTLYRPLVQAGVAHFPSNAPSAVSETGRTDAHAQYMSALRAQVSERAQRRQAERDKTTAEERARRERLALESCASEIEALHEGVLRRQQLQRGLEEQLAAAARPATATAAELADAKARINTTLKLCSDHVDTKLDPYFHQLASIQAHETMLLKMAPGEEPHSAAVRALGAHRVVVDPVTSTRPLCAQMAPAAAALRPAAAPPARAAADHLEEPSATGASRRAELQEARDQLAALNTVEAAKREQALALYREQVATVQQRRSAAQRTARLERARSLERLVLNEKLLKDESVQLRDDAAARSATLTGAWAVQVAQRAQSLAVERAQQQAPPVPSETRTGRHLFQAFLPSISL